MVRPADWHALNTFLLIGCKRTGRFVFIKSLQELLHFHSKTAGFLHVPSS